MRFKNYSCSYPASLDDFKDKHSVIVDRIVYIKDIYDISIQFKNEKKIGIVYRSGQNFYAIGWINKGDIVTTYHDLYPYKTNIICLWTLPKPSVWSRIEIVKAVQDRCKLFDEISNTEESKPCICYHRRWFMWRLCFWKIRSIRCVYAT